MTAQGNFAIAASSYSHPLCRTLASGADIIVVEHCRQVVGCFLDGEAKSIDRQSEGLADSVHHWVDREITYEESWDISVGAVHAFLLKRSSASAPVVAAALALHLHWNGYCSEWNAHFPVPVRLRFGHWLLPPCDDLRVRADPRAIDIVATRAGASTTHRFERRLDSPPPEDVIGLPVLPRTGTLWTVLCRDGLSATGLRDQPGQIDSAGFSTFAASCHAAVDLLDEYTKPYSDWVDGVIRYLVPLVGDSLDRFDSGSRHLLPGLLYLTNRHSPAQVAETFVHEASHQYFYILQRLETLFDPVDTGLYYSAVKGIGRPIGHILLAYHAFGNVCLFHRMAREAGYAGSAELAAYQAKLLNQVYELEAQLAKANSLTPSGLELWTCMSNCLHSREVATGAISLS
jgi:HEXXH motif-containing protein